MGYHGEKSRPKKAVEFWSQWTCVVCKRKVVPGAMVIGICNWNKGAGGNKGWDHVHVACAPHWDVQAPPRGGAPAPAGPSSSSAQDAAGPPPPVADTHNRDFMNRVVAMEFNEHEAQVIINHFNGDTRKAMSAMCEIFAARYDVVEMGEEAGQLEALLEAEQANDSDGVLRKVAYHMWMLTARVLSNREGRVRGYARVRTRVRVPVDLMSLVVMLFVELTYSF